MMPAQVTLSLDVEVKCMSTAASDFVIATPRRGEIFGPKMSNRLYDASGDRNHRYPNDAVFKKQMQTETPPTR